MGREGVLSPGRNQEWDSEISEDPEVSLQIEIRAKYTGYIDRQQEEIERTKLHDMTKIPEDFDYEAIKSLSNEVRQKLRNHRPENLGQASRISGMTPAAISILLIYLKRPKNSKAG